MPVARSVLFKSYTPAREWCASTGTAAISANNATATKVRLFMTISKNLAEPEDWVISAAGVYLRFAGRSTVATGWQPGGRRIVEGRRNQRKGREGTSAWRPRCPTV